MSVMLIQECTATAKITSDQPFTINIATTGEGSGFTENAESLIKIDGITQARYTSPGDYVGVAVQGGSDPILRDIIMVDSFNTLTGNEYWVLDPARFNSVSFIVNMYNSRNPVQRSGTPPLANIITSQSSFPKTLQAGEYILEISNSSKNWSLDLESPLFNYLISFS